MLGVATRARGASHIHTLGAVFVPNNSHRTKPLAGHRYSGSVHGGTSRAVSYSDCDPELLHAAVDAVTAAGDAVTFGRTSDGGAYYVGVLSDGMLEKFYLDSCDTLTACLQGVVRAGKALVE